VQFSLDLVEARFNPIFESWQQTIGDRRADQIGELSKRNQFFIAPRRGRPGITPGFASARILVA
jgi:hypothetical protein